MKKKIRLAVLSLTLACALLISACGAHGKTLFKAGGENLSVNLFELYLSRMKGDLSRAGYDVENADFWGQYVSTDNVTFADYFTDQVYEGLRQIAGELVLYDEMGLKPDKETEAEIDEWIASLVEEVGEGSKSALNSVLSAYGANVTVLRDAALIEAKIAQLKVELYGADASRVTDVAKEDFYRKNYYRGYQMLLANYYYDRETDETGDTVYYLDTGKIAYDTEHGTATAKTDKYGDTVYETDAGKVAYDTKTGTPHYYYTETGEHVTKNYTEAEMASRLAAAKQIAEDCKGNEALFLEYAKEFGDNTSFNETYAPNGMYFSAGTYHSDTVFSTFSTELSKLEAGEIVLLDSDSGYYLLMRATLDDGAWKNGANARWFDSLNGLVAEYMLQNKIETEGYLDRVTVKEKNRNGVDITMVGTNFYY